MKNSAISSFGIIFSLLLSNLFCQVQLFEQGRSGFVPQGGVVISPNVQQWQAGGDYTIDGKFSLRLMYGQSIADTIFPLTNGVYSEVVNDSTINISKTKILPYFIKPTLTFELVEPDKVMPLSFALEASFLFMKGKGDHITYKFIGLKHKQSIISGGPNLGIRLFVGGKGLIVPNIAYNFNYAFEERFVFNVAKNNKHFKSDLLWHDIKVSSPFNYMFTDMFGIAAFPELLVRIGGKEKFVDLIGTFNVGFVIRI